MPVMLHLCSAPLLSSRKEVQTDVRPARENHAIVKVKPWSQEWFIAVGAYPGFCSMKQLGVFLLPPGRDASLSQVTLPQFVRFSPTICQYLFTPGWREAL